ncbi:MAG TPA: HesA/MoeB/ThiF family protein [Sphingomicrobium sp.]|nr:HesA/MoeB/ThiF family protein [Sphingomicrobium sp.]
MTFTDDELERYARHIVLPDIGGAGQARLKQASAVIIGAGGMGSAAIPALAGAGFGRLTIIDDDVVELANLHRQPIFRTDQIGQPKADLAVRFVEAVNPFVEAAPVTERVDSGNADRLLAGHSLVIDGSDNFATRLAVGDSSVRLRTPLISAAAAQFQAQIGVWRGWEPRLPCYRCFVGDAFDADDCDNCAELGVLGALVGVAGHFAALMAIHAVVGFGEEAAGHVHVFDGRSFSWKKVRVIKDPNCRVCGGGNASHS